MEQQSAREIDFSQSAKAPAADRVQTLAERLRAGVEAAQNRLLELQHEDGHWCAELEGDSILESEYILVMHYLGRGGEEKIRKAANTIRDKQLEEGGWALYPGGAAEVSASVKAYFVLKLLGDEPGAAHMERARRKILELGGLDACNSYTKLYLSVFGQYDWAEAPAVPPELVLLPRWLPFNIYEMSAWSRAIVVPLSILWALKPTVAVPGFAVIDELRLDHEGRPRPAVGAETGRLWAKLFLLVDYALRLLERLHVRPLRRLALARAERWVLARLEKSDGLGAIFPPIINAIYALTALGYSEDHPALASQIEALERLEIEEGDTLRVQPCKSPVWDTGQALHALAASGLPADDPRLAASARWLVEHEARAVGDWRHGSPAADPGGWYFEYENELYPDCDDTAEVLTALSKLELQGPLEGRARAASQRGLAWLAAMQNRDGGWGSFDRGCERRALTHVPFADHNAMIDPSTTDITARALEALAAYGIGRDTPEVERAVAFIRGQQEPDGSWFGRWGCNYVYGTWLALWGLSAVGEDMSRPWARRAVAWLESVQNDDGGWGELPASYDDPALKGRGPSTAAQTAWALLGLVAAGDAGSASAGRGAEYLLATQRADGGWRDAHWTGTGFPKVFYLNYHYYSLYFPLLALAAYEGALDGGATAWRDGSRAIS